MVSLHGKFQVIPSISDHQMTLLSVLDVIRQNFQSQILAVLNVVHENKLHHWNPETKLHKIHVFLIKNVECPNLTFFDLI